MSVLIKGFKMPKHCIDCVLEEDGYCFLINDEVEPHDKSDNCPFVEVPTPHGRLIDADELREELFESSQFNTYNDYSMVIDAIDLAPTVIEGEA